MITRPLPRPSIYLPCVQSAQEGAHLRRKKSWGSNSGNTGDGGKIVGGAIGACGRGIGSGRVFSGEDGKYGEAVEEESDHAERVVREYSNKSSIRIEYRTQVACSKKFIVGKFLNFKMNDVKPVVKQVEELQIIVHEMEEEGATKHICNPRRMFVSYQKVNESEQMFMGNGTGSKIEGKGKVILKLTSGKDLLLSNVLHVPNITKNLISGPILSNKGFKLVFELGKFVITKGGVYVGNGYLDEGLFKLSVVTDDNVINNNNAGTSTVSVYMIGHSFLWHSRLCHVNFRSLQRMINLGMLPKCSKDKIFKCEICVEPKFTSHSHKSVEKSNEILGLIHIDYVISKQLHQEEERIIILLSLMIAVNYVMCT
ncbi:pol polyprotein [Tanacetum coccineum]